MREEIFLTIRVSRLVGLSGWWKLKEKGKDEKSFGVKKTNV